MDDGYYPPIQEDVIGPILVAGRLVAGDADYPSDPECPCGDDFNVVLRALSVRGTVQCPQVQINNVGEEAQRLYHQLKDCGESLEQADAAEKNICFRLSVALLEKPLGLLERAVNVKKPRLFQDAGVEILDDQLNPDQGTALTSGCLIL